MHPPVLEHGILRDLVIGHGFLELINLLQKEISDLLYGFNLQLFQDVFDVKARFGIFERLFFDEVNLVVQVVQVLHKSTISYRTLKNYTTREIRDWLID